MDKHENFLKELKDHIIELTNYDPSVKCRKRGYVNSRMLFCKIIDDKYHITNNSYNYEMTSEKISNFLDNAINRTVVSRNIKEIENVFITDKVLYNIYKRLKIRMNIPTDIIDQIDALNVEKETLLSRLKFIEKDLNEKRIIRNAHFGIN